MSLGFEEVFQCVMKPAECYGKELNLKNKSYQYCKTFWHYVIILHFSISINVDHGLLLTLTFAWRSIIDINNIDNQLDATVTAY